MENDASNKQTIVDISPILNNSLNFRTRETTGSSTSVLVGHIPRMSNNNNNSGSRSDLGRYNNNNNNSHHDLLQDRHSRGPHTRDRNSISLHSLKSESLSSSSTLPAIIPDAGSNVRSHSSASIHHNSRSRSFSQSPSSKYSGGSFHSNLRQLTELQALTQKGNYRKRAGVDMRRVSGSHDVVSPVKTLMNSRFITKSQGQQSNTASSVVHKGIRYIPKVTTRSVTSLSDFVELDEHTVIQGGSGSDTLNSNVEVWPANVDSYEANGQNQLTTAKPKVLQELERHLEQSLIRHRLSLDSFEKREGDHFDISQTQPYRECFRMFVDHFKTYKPLLTKIRNAYERAIEYALEKIHDTEYLKNQTSILEEEYKRKTDDQIAIYAQEIHEQRKEIRILREKLEKIEAEDKPFKDELEQKTRQVRDLEVTVANLESANRHIRESLKKLGGDKTTWEIDLETVYLLESEQKKTIELQERLRLKDMQLKKAMEQLDKSPAPEIPPLIQELKAKLTKRNTEYFKLKAQVSLLFGKLGRLEKEKAKEAKEVERLKTRLEPFMEENANLTPRPFWTNIISMNQKLLEPLREETSQATVQKIVAEYIKLKASYDTIQKELEEARNFIGLASRDSRLEEIQSNERVTKWFLGLGTSKDIPIFLQLQGKIANRKFSKGFTEEIINEFWDEKENTEDQLAGKQGIKGKVKRIPAKEFYHEFLTNKALQEIHEEQSNSSANLKDLTQEALERLKQKKIAEWSYSMMDSLKKSLYDPDCEMFYKIVYEGMSEDVYYEQNSMLQNVQEMLHKMKEQELSDEIEDEDSQAEKCGPTELLKSDILKGLREMFPLKHEESFRRLIVCLNKDFPGLYVDFVQLFEEDEDYNQREFVEEIRHQFVTEREDFIAEIEESVIEHDANNDGVVLLNEIHQSIMQVDPLRPINEVDNLIAQGLNVSVIDLNPILSLHGTRIYKGRLSTPISKFIERIRKLYIRRYTAVGDRDRILKELENEQEKGRGGTLTSYGSTHSLYQYSFSVSTSNLLKGTEPGEGTNSVI